MPQVEREAAAACNAANASNTNRGGLLDKAHPSFASMDVSSEKAASIGGVSSNGQS